MELCGGADTNTDLHWVLCTFNVSVYGIVNAPYEEKLFIY